MTEKINWLRDEEPSGYQKLIGYEVTDWREGYAEMALPVRQELTNRAGDLHGGVLATLVDSVGGFAGCFCNVEGNVRRCLTLTMSTSFVGPVKGGTIKAIGQKQGGGRRVFFSSVRIVNEDGSLIATGEGTYRYRGNSGSPEGEPLE